ncbi:MAG: RHS repeat-associated core domain-containing protein [Caldilineaceae bacterium]|nr:RHS repeat-associated core domain-containing protein [Caldilineaceae bacterium]
MTKRQLADSIRIKKTSNGVNTFTPFAHYEVDNGTTVKYYTFNGLRVAMRRGSTLYYLHGDHLGSTALTTTGSGVGTSQTYCAYGKTRSGTTCASGNSLATDRQFTGQKYDVTGLHYYAARYYDDHIGQFVSPDSMVPDASNLISWNRFAYAADNPLNFFDPTGHCEKSIGDDDYGCFDLAQKIHRQFPNVDRESLERSSIKYLEKTYEELLTDPPLDAPIAGVIVGVGVSADASFLGPVGFAFNGGIEVLAHKNGELALYSYGGGGGTVGLGANAKVYVGRVYRLSDADGYAAWFESTDVTASYGPLGATAGRFSDPTIEDGTYGNFVGYAPGVNASASQSVMYYTQPLVKYDFQSNTVTYPQLEDTVNDFDYLIGR